ncbi:MAG: hypothetical protein K2N57_02415 [Clostridia bacterium]|nr:hypothetical protein [Clostridia bacterium]
MESKKQEELEKMYALRAGLSLISQKCDELIEDNAKISQMQEDIYQLQQSKKVLNKTYIEQEVNKFKEDANVIYTGSSKRVINVYQELKEKSNAFFRFTRKSIPSIWDFLHEFIDEIVDENGDWGSGIWMIFSIIAHIFAAILILPISIPIILFDIIAFPFVYIGHTSEREVLKSIKKDKYFKTIKKEAQKDENIDTNIGLNTINELVDVLKGADYQFSKMENQIIKTYMIFLPSAIVYLYNYHDYVAKYKLEVGYKDIEHQNEELNKKENKMLDEYENKIQNNNQMSLQILTQCQLITKTLIELYSSTLDIRDWESLDFVIFNYETGRADSIKEALQLVDFERRNSNYKNSIKEASQAISGNIKENFHELGISKFESLFNQLEVQFIQMAELNREVCNTNGRIEDIAGDIKTASNLMITKHTLTNALLAKANVSSLEIVDQMKQLNSKIKNK